VRAGIRPDPTISIEGDWNIRNIVCKKEAIFKGEANSPPKSSIMRVYPMHRDSTLQPDQTRTSTEYRAAITTSRRRFKDSPSTLNHSII
jgi:hypothetical protein